MAPIPLLVFLFLIAHSMLLSSAEEKGSLPKCQPVLCGNDEENEFSFNNTMSPECGELKVKCSEDGPKIQFKPEGHWFRIEKISQLHSKISIVVKEEAVPFPPPDSNERRCQFINEHSLPSPTDSSHFSSYNYTADNLSTLYNCGRNLCVTTKDYDETKCREYDLHCNLSYGQQRCPNITLPFSFPPPNSNFTFKVQISPTCLGCHMEGGNCHDFHDEDQFRCILPHKGQTKKLSLGLGLELAVAFGGIGTLVVMLIYCFRKKHNHAHQSIEAFLKNCGPLQIRRYSYSNIKKMTNSFEEKLGQGGFGSVYKGKLHDGDLVAVKMLNKLKANDGEDFINEVAAISRTSHVNVVRLLGFCFEGAKKALIYEFMPNGSLEKFVYNENETEECYQLDWETYYQISLGTARGLEYLHRGCNTRILHFDIKPHNILLDADFVPKISDFGLAKICTRKDSLVSMLGPRGTIGYIAPEVFSRNFGGVSHKSDVYSYGMMVLEMVGGRKNVNIRVDNSSELYFPQWIYERLELKELGLKRIISEEDNVKSRKMIMTSLWCIQTDPSSRPTMSRVIEMLEGVEGLRCGNMLEKLTK
ncbi:LEAF RUST 10 DISEASE-RESISTANCE LOCUS RECEPTOR-LIKE PROTEIN KINASE-like 2.1 isoform X2 [Humulus lupulus]|uniref:LEAF RUST 10 DISEASE-RESISTANCE LOCUS RECEPTOR-LIKE PROTEIN KINASE-like 2.1 isoform X2 n=1 Tax=Humulus lupulus TaxID=3486 RepID=UPI002B40D35C|nr:LEAF RUST 10 DISEASE-RESISTANCE LOCUS RECEPTOR-LIKE PROTEIN KINASE-like 2.1 isoform X2 [Humulus lupulus]